MAKRGLDEGEIPEDGEVAEQGEADESVAKRPRGDEDGPAADDEVAPAIATESTQPAAAEEGDGAAQAADDADAGAAADAAAPSAEATQASSDASAAAPAASEPSAAIEAAPAPTCCAADHQASSAAASVPIAGEAGVQQALTDELLAQLLRERAEAKTRRDFVASDQIRLRLEALGVKIMDARSPGMVGTWQALDGRRCAPLPPTARLPRCPPNRRQPAAHPLTRSPPRVVCSALPSQGQHDGPRLFRRPERDGCVEWRP
jgi:hypothetical protein